MLLYTLNINFDFFAIPSTYEFLLLLFSVIGGIWALYQWSKTRQFNRANLIKELLVKIREDENIVDVLYSIDYGDEWCNISFFKDRKMQLKYDNTFALFDYICFLIKNSILSKKEISFFEYKIIRMANNQSFMNYMFNVYHFSNRNNSSTPFYYLIGYLKDNNLLCDEFYDKKTKKYKKYLNF